MNTSQGWIKLHRRLLRHPLWEFSTAEQKVLLVTLLMLANHAENTWHWNGQTFHCKPGQLITSLNSLADKCGSGVSRRKVQTALRFFENCGFLVKQTSRHNTLITICNWNTYQNIPEPDVTRTNQHLTNGCPDDVTPMLPNKKERRKNEKNIYLREKFSLPFYSESELQALGDDAPAVTMDPELAAWLAEEY